VTPSRCPELDRRRATPFLRALAPLILAAAACPEGAAAQQPAFEEPALEEGLFELFVQWIPERLPLLTLVDATGQVLIPLEAVLEHVGIPTSARADTLVLEWPPRTWRTLVARSGRTVVVGADTASVAPVEWAERDGRTFVSARTLGLILSARVDVVWADLVVQVSGDLAFPATLRLEQDARRARERLQATLFDPDTFSDVPYPARTGGLAAGWGFSLSEASGYRRGTARGALGASVLGGSTEVGATAVGATGERASVEEVFARYSRVFTDWEWLRRVEVGSVLSEGMIARRLHGFSLTNHPFTMPRYFGEAVVTPAVPAGWDYEVYQGEHLVGVSTADQPSEIRAPLNYGNTPVRIRMLGPAGQQRVEELVYVVPSNRVPSGAWRYTLGGGDCVDASCGSYWFGEIERGVAPWLTAGFGADRLAVSGSAPVKPFGSVGISPVAGLSADIQARPLSFLRTSLQYLAAASTSIYAAYTWTEPSSAFGIAGWTGQFAASGPSPLLAGRWMSARLLVRGLEHGSVDSWQGALSTIVRRTHVGLEAESGLQSEVLLTGRVFQALGARTFGPVRDVSLGGALGFGERRFQLGEAGVNGRVGDVRLDARLRARRGQDPVFTLAMSLRSPFGFFQARGSQGMGTGVFLGADGGIAFDPAVGLVPLTYQSMGRAGVAGHVYFDLNGDGTWNKGEPPVSGADVLVGGRRAPTDERGRFSAWEATPYEGLIVALDSLSVDPEWAPSVQEIRIRPSPNVFTEVTLGVHRTRELSGSVLSADPARRPLGGVRVEVVDRDGRVVATERTFSDGVFYVPRLRPGRYTVRVPPLAGRGAAQEVEVDVAVGDRAEVVAPPILLEGGD
jgi:hypothetical protein